MKHYKEQHNHIFVKQLRVENQKFIYIYNINETSFRI